MERMLGKMKASHEEMMVKMKVQIRALVSQMDDHHAETEANHEKWMAAMKASQERMEALMDVSLRDDGDLPRKYRQIGKVETKMEACLEEMKVQTIRALGDRPWYPRTHRKGGPRTTLYSEPLKDAADIQQWHKRLRPETAAMTMKQGKCQ